MVETAGLKNLKPNGGEMKTKNLIVSIKADDVDHAQGIFTGYASVFGNVDSYGDMVVKGAFTESLKSYGENGAGVPCYWSHQMSNPLMNLGQTLEAKEDERGLFVKVQLDLDNPNAVYTLKLIKEGRVKQMSFAFDIEDYAWAESDEHGKYFELRKLKLHEVSVVQVGANQETELLDVKDRLTRLKVSGAGETQLREASALIEAVLAGLDTSSKSADAEPTGDQPEPVVEDSSAGTKSGGNPLVALANLELIALEGA